MSSRHLMLICMGFVWIWFLTCPNAGHAAVPFGEARESPLGVESERSVAGLRPLGVEEMTRVRYLGANRVGNQVHV